MTFVSCVHISLQTSSISGCIQLQRLGMKFVGHPMKGEKI